MNLEVSLPPGMVLKYLLSRKNELNAPVSEAAQLKTIAHKMRGNASTFGLPQLGVIAGKVEDVLINSNPDSKSLQELQSQLMMEVDALIAQNPS